MIQETLNASVPFMKRRVKVRPHHIMGHRQVWQLNTTKAIVLKHGLCTVGTSLLQAMIDTITWSFEYRLIVLFRIIKIDLSLSDMRASSQTSERNYLAIVNTSLACYLPMIMVTSKCMTRIFPVGITKMIQVFVVITR